jgi:hypothetical protein
MAFDIEAVKAEVFEDRIIEVRVPDLQPWFGDSEPVWKVRGLTGDELGRVNEAVERHRAMGAIADGLVSPNERERAGAIRQLLGISDKTPAGVVRSLEVLVAGSVDPPCDMELAIKLKDNFPIEFQQIVNAILSATGKGRLPGKSKSSGAIPASEQA